MPETQAAEALPGILGSIVRTKQQELEALRPRAEALALAAAAAPEPRAFEAALRGGEHVSLIAECKRRSPGAGPIRPDLDPVAMARGYEDAGAVALSVLTDEVYFGGAIADLSAVRSATRVPVLRKDFTIDPLHLLEARAAGADAVLLIVRILTDALLDRLQREARALGMGVLVEVHDADELDRALSVGAGVIGINNRDLSTFRTEIDTTLRLLDRIPDEVVVVSESGIRDRGDVALLGASGVDAVLVGEALLRAEDPTRATIAMATVPREARRRA